MTKDERHIAVLNKMLESMDVYDSIQPTTERKKAIKASIKALSQEPKTGHWIYDDEYSDWFDVTYKCSCCKRAIIIPYEARNRVYKDYPYCHCGARMKGDNKQ